MYFGWEIPRANDGSGLVEQCGADDGGGCEWRCVGGTPDGLNLLHEGDVARAFTTADGLADDFVRSLYVGRGGEFVDWDAAGVIAV